VVAFTATQFQILKAASIDGIGRENLSGGNTIYPESDLVKLIKKHNIEL
jgi:hypothetical protein